MMQKTYNCPDKRESSVAWSQKDEGVASSWDDTPTSPRAILHHTDPNAPNISGGSVYLD